MGEGKDEVAELREVALELSCGADAGFDFGRSRVPEIFGGGWEHCAAGFVKRGAAGGRAGAEEFEKFRVVECEVGGFAELDAGDLGGIHFCHGDA